MSKVIVGAAAILGVLGTGSAFAGGIEHSAPSTAALFETGRYLEFSGRYVMPDMSGSGFGLAPGTNTGNLYKNYASLGFAYKADITDQLSYAIILDDPWGADTSYPALATSPVYSGTTADLDSIGLTGILAYDVQPNIKIYGGLRLQSMEATAAIPFIPTIGYTIDASRDYGFGYMVGAAYVKPEIALRVALTYYSEVDHSLDSTEVSVAGTLAASTDITTPQSVNLEFQTGIAADTLLFGSIRWVDWSNFSISPPQYVGLTGSPLVAYAKDWTNYSLGVGRKFNDTWSGALLSSYEPSSNTVLTTLGPLDGKASLGAAVTYTMGKTRITGGVSYFWLGDSTNVLGTNFTDGDAVVIGFRVAMAL